MRLKKWLCAFLALALTLGGAALAEGDPEARIAELEAKVAELTEELEAARALILEYEEKEKIITFDGGSVKLSEAQIQYDQVVAMYQAYGYSISGYEDMIRQQVAEMLLDQAVKRLKAEELGLAQLDEETLAAYEAQAKTTYESNINTYMSYYGGESEDTEAARAAAEEGLAAEGFAYEDTLNSLLQTHIEDELFKYVTAGVEVTEEDVRAAYDAAVEGDQANYAKDPESYERTRTNGQPVYWNPEGYRRVKHVLVKFNEEQAATLTELNSLISDLEGRIAAAAEVAPPEEGDEEEEDVDPAELQSQLDQARQELDALYEELMPKAQEVLDRFAQGEEFDALMEEYGEDPGMQREPGHTEGYYVCADSTIWEKAFVEGAMSIGAVGEISQPVRGRNGIHIIYYLADVPAGGVDYETVREALEETAYATKQDQVFDDALASWKEELHVEYHLERFR